MGTEQQNPENPAPSTLPVCGCSLSLQHCPAPLWHFWEWLGFANGWKHIQGLFPQGLCKGVSICLSVCLLQGGPGHLYLLKNKVATFAKVEKEEDLIL